MSDVYHFGTTAFLGRSSSVVKMVDSTGFIEDSKAKTSVTPANMGKKEVEFVSWGADNKTPLTVLEKIHNNVTVASNIDFNVRIAYGDGLMVVKKERDKATGDIVYKEMLPSEAPLIFDFLDDNNVTQILQEAANDIVTFHDAYIELVFNREPSPRVAMVRHKETTFSRLSVMNEKTGKIEYHGYTAKWGTGTTDDVIATPLLDRDAPLYDIKKLVGLLPDEKTGRKTVTKEKRFILSLGLPVPGRFYYNKPYWWSIFPSGWYDFACSIPKFKQALIANEMVLKYEIAINEKYWDKLYKEEGITDKKKQGERQLKFLTDLDDFLASKENAGKSFVKHFSYDQMKGFERHDIIIKPIESFLKGGEYIEDVEEASNVISYAMGVHPSLQGATPGKGKSINGTEARELFIIKQAMTKPLRDALLSFLYIIKAVNGWDKDIHFAIPNIMLTTLDKNTGAEKNIGNQKI